MQKLNKKQWMNQRVNHLMFLLTQDVLDEEQAEKLTMTQVHAQFPKKSYYKNYNSGEIRVGLSFKGVRKLVKKYPHIDLASVKQYFNVA